MSRPRPDLRAGVLDRGLSLRQRMVAWPKWLPVCPMSARFIARRFIFAGAISAETPLRPARPVRPERCSSVSALVGNSAWITSSKVRQVDAACGNISRHTNLCTTVAHGLQGVAAFLLGQLARQRHSGKATVGQAGRQTCHAGARVTKHNRVWGIVEAQSVDDRRIDVVVCHCKARYSISVCWLSFETVCTRTASFW